MPVVVKRRSRHRGPAYGGVNLYPVELKNIPLGLSKKRFFMTDIVGKLWGFCYTLRHDGIDYGDYIEQLTYLLFLKMIEE